MECDQYVVPKIVAWLATLFCVLFSARCAATFLCHNARLFTAMALFAMAWALLLPFYSSPASSELFVAYGGFLLVFVGGLLHREGSELRGGEQIDNHADPLHRLALWLLALIAVPSVASFALPDGSSFGMPQSDVESVFATTFDVLGYASIAIGVRLLSPGLWSTIVVGLASAYSISEIVYTIHTVMHEQSVATICSSYWVASANPPMTETWLLVFAVLKVLFTCCVAWAVTLAGLKEEDSRLSRIEKMLKLIGAGRA